MSAQHVVDIRAGGGSIRSDLREIWAFRQLLWTLVWRDLTVRYRQMVLGIAWVVIQPLAGMAVFTLVFHKVAGLDTADAPYPLFAVIGLLLWGFIAAAVQSSALSLTSNQQLVSKVYFPRAILPLATVGAALFDWTVSSLLLVPLFFLYGRFPSWTIVLLPAVTLGAIVLATGLGLWAAALNSEYRDIRVVIPFVLQLWMYCSPVVYPRAALPLKWRELMTFNPATGLLEGFRACLLGSSPPVFALLWSAVIALLLLSSGAIYFRHRQRSFADTL